MTQAALVQKLSIMAEETDNDTLLTYLELAAGCILQKLYPYDTENKIIPEKYQTNQLLIADFLLKKRGAEGQTVHNENGINRSWESGGIPESFFAGIVPTGKVCLL